MWYVADIVGYKLLMCFTLSSPWFLSSLFHVFYFQQLWPFTLVPFVICDELFNSGWFIILTRWWSCCCCCCCCGWSFSLSLTTWRLTTRRLRRLWWWLIWLFSSSVTSVHEHDDNSSPSLPMTRSPGIGDSIGDSDRTRKVELLTGSSLKRSD